MKIHLLRSKEYSEQQYAEVLLFLNSFDGPVTFLHGGTIDPVNKSTWQQKTEEDEFFRQEFPKKLKFEELVCRSSPLPAYREMSDWENLC